MNYTLNQIFNTDISLQPRSDYKRKETKRIARGYNPTLTGQRLTKLFLRELSWSLGSSLSLHIWSILHPIEGVETLVTMTCIWMIGPQWVWAPLSYRCGTDDYPVHYEWHNGRTFLFSRAPGANKHWRRGIDRTWCENEDSYSTVASPSSNVLVCLQSSSYVLTATHRPRPRRLL